jgi:hypothetical protein
MEPENSTDLDLPSVDLNPEPPAEDESGSRPKVTFMGNSYDLTAVAGVTTAGVTLFACGTCGTGFYCLPLVPVILGAVGLLSLKDAVDPERTKKLSWISIGVGALFLALVALLFLVYLAYFGFIFFLVASDGGSGF